MIIRHRGRLLLCLAFFFFPALVFPEIKVTDQLGLIRATSKREAPVTVIVRVAENAGPQPELKLVNIDGLAADIRGRPEGAGRYVFDAAGEGTWRIRSEPKNVKLLQVSFKK